MPADSSRVLAEPLVDDSSCSERSRRAGSRGGYGRCEVLGRCGVGACALVHALGVPLVVEESMHVRTLRAQPLAEVMVPGLRRSLRWCSLSLLSMGCPDVHSCSEVHRHALAVSMVGEECYRGCGVRVCGAVCAWPRRARGRRKDQARSACHAYALAGFTHVAALLAVDVKYMLGAQSSCTCSQRRR